MYRKAVLAVVAASILTMSVKAGEVTDAEFNNLLNLVTITYWSGDSKFVSCVVKNDKGKPIGGGEALPRAGVARVVIQIPSKYADLGARNPDALSIECRS